MSLKNSIFFNPSLIKERYSYVLLISYESWETNMSETILRRKNNFPLLKTNKHDQYVFVESIQSEFIPGQSARYLAIELSNRLYCLPSHHRHWSPQPL